MLFSEVAQFNTTGWRVESLSFPKYDLSDIFNSEDIFAPQPPNIDIAEYMKNLDKQIEIPLDNQEGRNVDVYDLLDDLEAEAEQHDHQLAHQELQCHEIDMQLEMQLEIEKQKDMQLEIEKLKELKVEVEIEGQIGKKVETITIIRLDENNNLENNIDEEAEIKEVARKKRVSKKVKDLDARFTIVGR